MEGIIAAVTSAVALLTQICQPVFEKTCAIGMRFLQVPVL